MVTLAFYLPQYHPIVVNNQHWGNGYTEWSAVHAARQWAPMAPIAKPRLSELGFYDLRTPGIRAKQYRLAASYGVDGFLVWHYWFEGKTVFNAVMDDILQDNVGDFRFALAWANESWTGRWHGLGSKVLLRQTYGDADDVRRHAEYLANYMLHQNYIFYENRPIIFLYRPANSPNVFALLERMNEALETLGVPNPYWVVQAGFEMAYRLDRLNVDGLVAGIAAYDPVPPRSVWGTGFEPGQIIDIEDVYRANDLHLCLESADHVPLLIPNWDTTPRMGRKSRVVRSSPDRWLAAMRRSTRLQSTKPSDLFLLKSWNEWGEGNFLEPDEKYGRQWLCAWRDFLSTDAEEFRTADAPCL